MNDHPEIHVHACGLDEWAVIFTDDNGRSILSKHTLRRKADARARYFRKVLDSGALLKPDASAYS